MYTFISDGAAVPRVKARQAIASQGWINAAGL